MQQPEQEGPFFQPRGGKGQLGLLDCVNLVAWHIGLRGV